MLEIVAITALVIMLIALVMLVKALSNLQINLIVSYDYGQSATITDVYDKDGNLIIAEDSEDNQAAFDEMVKAMQEFMTDEGEVKRG